MLHKIQRNINVQLDEVEYHWDRNRHFRRSGFSACFLFNSGLNNVLIVFIIFVVATPFHWLSSSIFPKKSLKFVLGGTSITD